MTHSQEHFTKQAVPISCKENALFVKCIFYLAANHITVHCCHVKAVCLHADHAHQTLPSPTTGTIRRQCLRCHHRWATESKAHSVSAWVCLPDCEHTGQFRRPPSMSSWHGPLCSIKEISCYP